MSLSIGIVGLPNSGKSTLFNAITKSSVPAENFPFCTIDPSVGVVAVPDERLEKLSTLSKSEKIISSTIEFTDIAGLVKGAHKGEGLGNEFLSHIRKCDVLLQIVRVFENKDIVHVEGEISPIRDIEIINLELILSDLETVNKRMQKLEKDVRRGDKDAKKEQESLIKAKSVLENEKKLIHTKYDKEDEKIFKTNGLLSYKPVLYILNKSVFSKNTLDNSNELKEYLEKEKMSWVTIDALSEGQIGEDTSLREEMNLTEKGLDLLIQESVKLLDLIVFFTSGEKETRAWQIKNGSTAPEAGAAIHTDFKEKFIRAEVVSYKDLITSGSYQSARDAGLVKIVGKEYIVQDGDVIQFRI